MRFAKTSKGSVIPMRYVPASGIVANAIILMAICLWMTSRCEKSLEIPGLYVDHLCVLNNA